MQYKQQTSHQTIALTDEDSNDKLLEIEPSPVEQYHRLYYLDWLRVLAVTGVFLAHTITIFNILYWHANESRGAGASCFRNRVVHGPVLFTGWGKRLVFFGFANSKAIYQ